MSRKTTQEKEHESWSLQMCAVMASVQWEVAHQKSTSQQHLFHAKGAVEGPLVHISINSSYMEHSFQ